MRNRIQSEAVKEQDRRILRFFFGVRTPPLAPKEIVVKLNLTSVWVVYGAIRRFKYRPGWFHIEPKTNQNEQTPI